jgi:NAD(P)-dependent dehydrogenase (short-subunit alcohol dehydrogenase family)
VVVTGGGRGIGAATARLAGSQGYAVCVNYRADREHAEEVVSGIRAGGGTAISAQGDVSREEVARAILWLLSPEASYSTGTFIDVSGGR